MKLMYIMQAVLLVVGSAVLFLFSNWRAASSYAVGTTLSLANVALLAVLWGRLLQKKLVALSLFIIVFKYAILGAILYQLLKTSWLSPAWFCVGLGTVMLAALGMALFSDSDAEQPDPSPLTGSKL